MPTLEQERPDQGVLPRSKRRASAVAPRNQSGLVLIESVIGIALTSILVATLAGAVLMLIRVTDQSSDLQRVQTELGNFAERLKALPYADCALPADYTGAASYAPTAGVTVDVVDIDYWERTPAGGGPGDWTTTPCTNAVDDDGAQRLTVEAELGEHLVQVQMVKGAR